MKSDGTVIRLCEVLSVEDDQAGLRIKVRLEPEDSDCLYIKDLPYCFPLLPKHLHLNPKVGECVLIFLSNQNSAKGNRFFIGPVVSQQYALNYDPYDYQSRCLLVGDNIAKPLPNPNTNPENEGTIPDQEDIALQGRQNCDVVLKDNELRLRCGFKQNPSGKPENTLLFNREDLGYVMMRYKQQQDKKGKEFASTINLVADRINLLSHDSKTDFTLNDRTDLITDDEMLNVLENAHPLPYGDELISFLKRLVEVIRTHTHPFPMMPPSFTTPQEEVLSEDLDAMLSKAIRIN